MKNRANTLSAILGNMEDLEGAYKSAMNASGSAERELNTYLDSIQGHLDKFTNQLQTFWMNLLDSDMIKGVVDLGTNIVGLVDTIGLLPTALAAVLFYLTAIKKVNVGAMVSGVAQKFQAIGAATTSIKNIKKQNLNANGQPIAAWDTFNSQHIDAYANSVKELTVQQQVARLAAAGLNEEHIKEALIKNSVSEENARLAISEAKAANQIKQTTTLTGAQVLTFQNRRSLSLSLNAANFLLEHSEEQITQALLDRAVAENKLQQEEADSIMLAQKKVAANQNAKNSFTGLGVSIKGAVKQYSGMLIMMGATAFATWIDSIETAQEAFESLKEEFSDLQSAISELEGEIGSLDSELSTIQEQIDELTHKDSLSLADAEELNLLKQQSAELERQKELQEKILKARTSQEEKRSLQMINSLLSTTAANQQRTAESWEGAGKVIVGVLGAILGVVAAYFTGGSSLTLTSASIGLMAGGTIGSAAGGAFGNWAGNNATKISADTMADSLTEWYDSYEDAIEKASTEATEAEAKYLQDITDANYDAWQKKLETVTTLQTEMYDGLTELQEYIGTLEYTDETQGIIDGYNKLMTHIDVKSTEGNIDAQVESIKALEDEFAELSRGVDANGQNIALSTEEYARYCSIIEQLLMYTPQLIQSYDKEGNAILNRNSLIQDSIDLLRERQRLAAEDIISDENILSTYKSTKEQYGDAADFVTVSLDDEKYGGNLNYDLVDTKIITDIVGVELGAGEQLDDYIARNLTTVQFKLPEILTAVRQDMQTAYRIIDDLDAYDEHGEGYGETHNEESYTESGEDFEYYTQEEIDAMMVSFESYLTDVFNAAEEFSPNLNQFRQTLYTVPQASEHYYDLSGTDLEFINSYIDSFEDLSDLTDDEVKNIRDSILSLTNTIATDKSLQNSINDLLSLDKLSIPVGEYESKFNKIWEDIKVKIPEDQQDSLLHQLFPDRDKIDGMQNDVKAELLDTSKELVESLSLQELQVAWQIRAELPDDASFAELKEAIATELPDTGPIVQTFSTLSSQAERFNEISAQTAEIVLNNTKVTQEYKDALVELGISEEELETCFDSTNDLVVTNTKKLNKLIQSAKSNTTQNVKLAKSQARLQYYEKYKELQKLTNGQKASNIVTLSQVKALYQEMSALEKTITRYSFLEAKLLDATNAYERFQEAQEIDSETDYIASAEEMALALGEAFNTGKLGTEAAQVAIQGLVPESVYEDLDAVEDKMASIYEYFKEGKIAQYFDLEFNDDGSISSVEMKLGNLRKFIEDGLLDDGANVFDGEDWMNFNFSDEFMAQLDELPANADKLKVFADAMGVTKEVALAFLKTLEDHDISWLNGDYSSLIEMLSPDDLDASIQRVIGSLAELETKVASGEISPEEYAAQYSELDTQLSQLGESARSSITDYSNLTAEIDAQKTIIDECTEAITRMRDSGTSEEVIEASVDYHNLVDASEKYTELIGKRNLLAQPTEITLQFAKDEIQKELDELEDTINHNHYRFDVEAGEYVVKLNENHADYQKVVEFVDLMNEQHVIDVMLGGETETTQDTLADIGETLSDIAEILKIGFEFLIDADGGKAAVDEFKQKLAEIPTEKTVTVNTVYNNSDPSTWTDWRKEHNYAKVDGTAHASGNWGLPTNEHNSLVGELGPELVVDPHSGSYYTVGDHGAEMVDLPKGAIIFNHQQTKSLLQNGHVTSRGKAYASGNAHIGTGDVVIYPQASSQNQWDGTGYSSWDDPTYDAAEALSDAADSASDAAEEFREVFDWIEVRLEEINEQLDLRSAKLENAVGYSDKNSIINEMIEINEELRDSLLDGANKYYSYAQTLLGKIPEQYRTIAQDGTIAIEEFANEVGETNLQAIQEYREWAQKVADLKQELEGVKTELRDLAIQKIDNAYDSGSVRATVEDSQTEKLQNAVDYDEERGLITSDAYYLAMMENSNKKIEYLTKARTEMQKEFNKSVQDGTLIRGSNEWYEQLDKLYGIDAEIDEATIELEQFQNAINDIYWDNFDELINRLDYLKDETQNLIDLMDSDDMVAEPEKKKYKNGTVEYWTADDVKWTDEGIASLGLYAQQMEIAEYQSKQYAEAIDVLTADYKKGLYSENEYLEKLNELKDAQYENIEAYYDAQDAIVELNETRIESVKSGIEAEIDAYSELIAKKKEELDTEKD